MRYLRRRLRRIRDWLAGLPASTTEDLEALEDRALAGPARRRRLADRELRRGETVSLEEFTD